MRATLDGNEAAVSVAYRLNEVCCIYPITPASPMAELADEWATKRRQTCGGACPRSSRCKARAGRPAPSTALSGRGAFDDVHGVAGSLADDPEHVQDRRRVDSDRVPRRGPHGRHPSAVDIR